MTAHPLSTLQATLPAGHLITNRVQLRTYAADAGLDRGVPDGVAFPQTTDEVAQIVRWALANNVPLIARGAGTGLSGGAVAERGGLVVQFSRMNAVLEFDAEGRRLHVQPGAVNQTIDALVKQQGLYYPPDPSSGRVATIGGNIAENSGGPHCFKYGVTTNYVTGLTAVLADGQVARFGGAALDYPEYDFVGLLNGSEGTLAVITEACLRLVGNPPAVKTLMAAFDSIERAGQAVSAIIASGLVPTTLEMMDQRIMRIIEDYTHGGLPVHAAAALIVEADGYPESVATQIDEMAVVLRQHGAVELRIAQSDAERDLIWYGRKSAVGAMSRLAPAYYLVDVTVPRSQLAATLAQVNQICEAHDLRVGYVFHAGDGNLHPLILIERPSDHELLARVHAAGKAIVELCVAVDGSITGEHGVGIEKRAYMPLMYTPAELQAMQAIKHLFDPHELLNPGKIFPEKTPQLQLAVPRVPAPTVGETVQPASPTEAAAILQAALAEGYTIRLRGGGTKSAHLPPADVTISTAGMTGISAYAREDLYVTVNAGTTLAALQAGLAADGWWVPLASPWPEATIGGIVASNLNAPLRSRYGAIRDLVLATTVALANGEVIRAGRPVVKNVAGYDMPKLFVGSHGTLGLLCDVTLKLAPLPRVQKTLVVPIATLAAGLQVGRKLAAQRIVASAVLLCDGHVVGEAAPYTLLYTAEGLDEDVTAELNLVAALLQRHRLMARHVDTPGTVVWAGWLQAQVASRGEVLRIGVPPAQCAALVEALATQAQCMIDLCNSLVYTAGDVRAVMESIAAVGGYAVPLLAGRTRPVDTHPTPTAELTTRLAQRWGTNKQLNPASLPVAIA
ncbi:MAG: FAD-binding protein [Roseiflexaceae bacterium]|nr:FAD-binding protein [Roseiflexaceae bacterium]